MELKYDVVKYLADAGGPHHHLELNLSGIKLKDRRELINLITAAQNDDGSWPAGLVKGKPGSVPFSAWMVELLRRAGEEPTAKKGAAWLAAMQRPDGGFAENAALAETLKPEWEWFSTSNPVTWITGEAMVALAAVGGYNAQVNAARNLLFRARNRRGGWPGQVAPAFADRTDLWTVTSVVRGLLAAGTPANHDVFAGIREVLREHRNRWHNPVENPFAAFLALGRRLSDADVQESLTVLAESQNADGGWPYEAGGPSHPDITVGVWTVLVRYGLATTA